MLRPRKNMIITLYENTTRRETEITSGIVGIMKVELQVEKTGLRV